MCFSTLGSKKTFCETNPTGIMSSIYLLGVVLCLAVSAHSASIKQAPREEAATRKFNDSTQIAERLMFRVF